MNFDDFAVKEICNVGISITNLDISLMSVIGIFLFICVLFSSTILWRNIVYKIWQMIENLLQDDNSISNVTFFFSIFFIIFVGNFVGNIPGLFPMNSLLMASMPITISIIIYGLFVSMQKNGWCFIRVFFSPKIPLIISIFIGIVELTLLISKVISFSLRLTANITAGHIIIGMLNSFVLQSPWYLKIIPFLFLIIMYIVEILIGGLQAYIYLLLSINLFRGLIHIH